MAMGYLCGDCIRGLKDTLEEIRDCAVGDAGDKVACLLTIEHIRKLADKALTETTEEK
jgi:hypothetical protein